MLAVAAPKTTTSQGGTRHITSGRKATMPMAKSAGAKIALVQTGVQSAASSRPTMAALTAASADRIAVRRRSLSASEHKEWFAPLRLAVVGSGKGPSPERTATTRMHRNGYRFVAREYSGFDSKSAQSTVLFRGQYRSRRARIDKTHQLLSRRNCGVFLCWCTSIRSSS